MDTNWSSKRLTVHQNMALLHAARFPVPKRLRDWYRVRSEDTGEVDGAAPDRILPLLVHPLEGVREGGNSVSTGLNMPSGARFTPLFAVIYSAFTPTIGAKLGLLVHPLLGCVFKGS